ncbi:MAG: sugar phosphate isomerase/epimerase [Chloroflexota bacterium]|nr:sugar phosphate isomerase/epimerase [Chloroflexota bacterium]
MSEDHPSSLPSLPDGIHFAVGSALFGNLEPEHVALIAALGFPGIEPYRGMVLPYVERPQALKDLLDRHGVAMATCSNGGPGQATNFIDPAIRQTTIDDHVAFARDFLAVFGCQHFKINMGSRPPQGSSAADLHAIADTLNELGRRTAEYGIRLAPHPHIWGPIERPEEIRTLLELTDPNYVSLTLDTAHILLGGGDPMAFLTQHAERIAALHWKDTEARYRGYTGPTPTRAMHDEKILYKDLGTGGVDLSAVWQWVRERGYRYWITLDLDPPRPNEGEGTAEEKLRINRQYLLDNLHVTQL